MKTELGQNLINIMLPQLAEELLEKLTPALHTEILPIFYKKDSAAIFVNKLPQIFSTEMVSSLTKEQRVWEIIGLYYINNRRNYEALSIFMALYHQMLMAEMNSNRWIHKGMPLVYIADCYSRMDCPVHAKRYLMLTLCEDAIRELGSVSPDTTGIYFRLVWQYGLPDAELQRYAKEMFELLKAHEQESIFPEWILQSLDQNWMTEFPTIKEASIYSANVHYVKHLLTNLGDPQGKNLELLAEYILSCMPGCRTKRRERSRSTDYDIVCSIQGVETDFRSEMGRYFVCECKDWSKPADFSAMAKFCRVLDSTKARFGILFSKQGITGQGTTEDAEREQLKIFHDRSIVIVIIDQNDLEIISNGANFINLLQRKYEKIRLDLI